MLKTQIIIIFAACFFVMGRLFLVLQSEKIDIYSPKYDGESITEFEKFLIKNKDHKNPQLKAFFDAIVSAIDKILECGARENLFRPEGGKVKAVPLLIDYPRINKSIGKIRLYCLRVSEQILIIGGGGVTLKQKYQDDPAMLKAVNNLRDVYGKIVKQAKNSRIDYEDYNAISEIINSIVI